MRWCKEGVKSEVVPSRVESMAAEMEERLPRESRERWRGVEHHQGQVFPGDMSGDGTCFAVSSVPIDHSDLVADLLKELSNHNERVEERKGALLELLKITREDSLGVWEEHFKTILLLLLETLGDKDVRPGPFLMLTFPLPMGQVIESCSPCVWLRLYLLYCAYC